MTTLVLKERAPVGSDIVDTSCPDIAIFSLHGKVHGTKPDDLDPGKEFRFHRLDLDDAFPVAAEFHQFCKFHLAVQRWADKTCKQLGVMLCKVPPSVLNFDTRKKDFIQEGVRMVNAINVVSVMGLSICSTPIEDLEIERVDISESINNTRCFEGSDAVDFAFLKK